jgi:hypothetical protein
MADRMRGWLNLGQSIGLAGKRSAGGGASLPVTDVPRGHASETSSRKFARGCQAVKWLAAEQWPIKAIRLYFIGGHLSLRVPPNKLDRSRIAPDYNHRLRFVPARGFAPTSGIGLSSVQRDHTLSGRTLGSFCATLLSYLPTFYGDFSPVRARTLLAHRIEWVPIDLRIDRR